VPLHVAARALEAFNLAERTARLRNPHLNSDVACALHFARATLDAAAANVRVNHRYLRDAAIVEGQHERLTAIERRATEREGSVRALLADGP